MTPEDGHYPFQEILSTEAEIEAINGTPHPRAFTKTLNKLDDLCLEFIARSPFILISSCDSVGRQDVSPKGDPPGFVQVIDDRTLAIPERPGNRRADTFRNVLQNPRVGLIFLVPGKAETLRVSGTARIVRDAWVRERMAVGERVPQLALIVTVEEAFVHCTKCMVRSKLWQPDTWNPHGLVTIGQAIVTHAKADMSVAEMQALTENDERTRLY
jgi:PPOX class probable FMN-dependent enzyme